MDTIKHKLSNGFLGLTNSRKGVICLILFFCSLIPMTYLCFHGKLDSTAYAACMSAITVAVTAIFCHTQSKTDQMSMNNPTGPMGPIGPMGPMGPMNPIGMGGFPLNQTISSVVSTAETVIGTGPPANLPENPL
jgi:hypothetical protein